MLAARGKPLNFEMAVTAEMQAIALRHRPHAVCLVPERREERTTEGGLDVAGGHPTIGPFVRPAGRRRQPRLAVRRRRPAQIAASHAAGAQVVELHTGAFCDAVRDGDAAAASAHLKALRDAAAQAADLGLEVHAGHGIDYETVAAVAAIPQVMELNIGHFLIGEAIFVGLGPAIARMRRC
jgi:pyridoxine 5-phosphate synthase